MAQALIDQLIKNYPPLTFVVGGNFCWSPASHEISYIADANDKASDWALVHEVTHALLGHTSFTSDFSLLKQEVEAWAKASELAASYALTISSDYIEDCLDSYRDWLYARSTCPRCTSASLQADDSLDYLCFNCGNRWTVSRERFCRPYRRVSDRKASLI